MHKNIYMNSKSSFRASLFPPQKNLTKTRKIFVGGLSAPTTSEDIRKYFEKFGPVSCEEEGLFNVSVLLIFKNLS